MPRRFHSRANRFTATFMIVAQVAPFMLQPLAGLPTDQPLWAQDAAARPADEDEAAPALAAPDNQLLDDQTPQLDGEELTRGPVHEAFAQPVVFDPEPGPVIQQKPPASIEEIPPDEKPVGDDVTWISGYWAWDEEDERFLWVSGLWRVEPPDLQWVPGYWAEVDGGFQWVSGFWQRDEKDEVEYLPPPPDSLENGPPGQPASIEQTWVPGSWVWLNARYAWRPGYYVTCRPGWIWVPARYAWTPLGYVFVDGFWDYSVRRRGILYAPVRINPGFVVPLQCRYRPRVVIDTDIFTNHFFCRPTVGLYYFGDYYSTNYLNRGFYPRHAFHMSAVGYDPIFAYHSWFYAKTDPGWRNRVRADYHHCRDHIDARPPITVAQTRELALVANDIHNRGRVLATSSIAELASRPQAAVQVERVTAQQRERLQKNIQQIDRAQKQRREQELNAVAQLDPNRTRPGRPEGKPDVRPEGKPDVRPEGKPDVRPVGKPDVRPEGKPDVRPEGKPDVRPDGKPDVRPEGKPDVRPEGKPNNKPDGKPDDVRPERPATVTPDGKPDGKPDRVRDDSPVRKLPAVVPAKGRPDRVKPNVSDRPARPDLPAVSPDVTSEPLRLGTSATERPKPTEPRPAQGRPGRVGKDRSNLPPPDRDLDPDGPDKPTVTRPPRAEPRPRNDVSPREPAPREPAPVRPESPRRNDPPGRLDNPRNPPPAAQPRPEPRPEPRPQPRPEPRREPRPEPRPQPQPQPRPQPQPPPRAQPRPDPQPRPQPSQPRNPGGPGRANDAPRGKGRNN